MKIFFFLFLTTLIFNIKADDLQDQLEARSELITKVEKVLSEGMTEITELEKNMDDLIKFYETGTNDEYNNLKCIQQSVWEANITYANNLIEGRKEEINELIEKRDQLNDTFEEKIQNIHELEGEIVELDIDLLGLQVIEQQLNALFVNNIFFEEIKDVQTVNEQKVQLAKTLDEGVTGEEESKGGLKDAFLSFFQAKSKNNKVANEKAMKLQQQILAQVKQDLVNATHPTDLEVISKIHEIQKNLTDEFTQEKQIINKEINNKHDKIIQLKQEHFILIKNQKLEQDLITQQIKKIQTQIIEEENTIEKQYQQIYACNFAVEQKKNAEAKAKFFRDELLNVAKVIHEKMNFGNDQLQIIKEHLEKHKNLIPKIQEPAGQPQLQPATTTTTETNENEPAPL